MSPASSSNGSSTWVRSPSGPAADADRCNRPSPCAHGSATPSSRHARRWFSWSDERRAPICSTTDGPPARATSGQKPRRIQPRRNSPPPRPKRGSPRTRRAIRSGGGRGWNRDSNARRARTGISPARPWFGFARRPARGGGRTSGNDPTGDRLDGRGEFVRRDERRYPASRQLSDSADAQTRTYDARYVLDGEASAAPLGATVTVRLAGEVSRPEVQVPLGAVLDDGRRVGVWVFDGANSTVHFQPVALMRVTSETAVISGLRAGDPIVALGAHLLHEGARVRTGSNGRGV